MSIPRTSCTNLSYIDKICARAKYPLSIVNRLLEIVGDRILVGYDIGCTFGKTIESTPLGKRFTEGGSRCCVNAYHGYAHNFACQCKNHPNNIPGSGLEDFEGMERLFCESNLTAPVIRYCSKYRREQFLDLFLRRYDGDKYLYLGLMLLNNYKQALGIKKEYGAALDEICKRLGFSIADLDSWQITQAEFFSTNGKEPEADLHRVAYVELLQELRDARYVHDCIVQQTGFGN